MQCIYFDEAGNTGSDLLNKDQPVFTMASINISNKKAIDLLSEILVDGTKEAKFTNLKSGSAGLKRLSNFFTKQSYTKEIVCLTICHKKYFVVTKIVDFLYETLAYRDGLDLYKDGANIGLSNLLFYCTPALCDESLYEKLLEDFVNMIRSKSKVAIEAFFNTAEKLIESSSSDDYKSTLSPLIAAASIIDDVLANNSSEDIDPAIPFFVNHCAWWGEKIGKIVVVHDDSNLIEEQKVVLNQIMDPKATGTYIGYDRRKYLFPLKVEELKLINSSKSHELQIADIFAGSACAYGMHLSGKKQSSKLMKIIEPVCSNDLIINSIWPHKAFTPKELDTLTKEDDINAVDYIAGYLKDQKN